MGDDSDAGDARDVAPLNGTHLNGKKSPFICKKSGEPLPILANVITLLNENSLAWDLGFDEFSHRLFKGDEYLEDKHFLELTNWAQRQGIHASSNIVAEATQYTARDRPFHQVREYLSLLEWDKTPRLANMLIKYAGAQDDALVRAHSMKWMIQAVARVMEPGCQADATLVLEGDQGVGKSSFLRTLFSDPWFTDHLPSLESKDAEIQLRGVWCAEISELAALSKHDSKRTNAFLTQRIGRYRDPYGRIAADYPRQNVFAGTVNPGAGGYLKDETGGRRFWSVSIIKAADIPGTTRDRDQLWAEAVAYYTEGKPWYFDTPEAVKTAADAQRDRYVGDPWQDTIERYVALKEHTTLQLVLEHLGFQDKADWTQREMNRVASCLANCNWERYRMPVDELGQRPWGYRKKLVADTKSVAATNLRDTPQNTAIDPNPEIPDLE